ncbi:MAG: hypothetical protein H6735_12090 [Alphaproteobacteria bacterium]|nr:hypothetical protein [Alphaproteobacteria bacterium]
MPPELDPGGLRWVIQPPSRLLRRLVVAGLSTVAGAGVLLGVGAPPVTLVGALVLGGATWVWSRPRPLELTCDRYVVRWRRGGRWRERPFLDLAGAWVDDGGCLVLDPQPGPLFPEVIDTSAASRAEVEEVAQLLRDAIPRAESRRGDAEQPETWRIGRLVDPRRE